MKDKRLLTVGQRNQHLAILDTYHGRAGAALAADYAARDEILICQQRRLEEAFMLLRYAESLRSLLEWQRVEWTERRDALLEGDGRATHPKHTKRPKRPASMKRAPR